MPTKSTKKTLFRGGQAQAIALTGFYFADMFL